MKTIVTETALKTKFWSASIRTVAYFLGNGFTVPQPRPIFIAFTASVDILSDKYFKFLQNIIPVSVLL